MNNDTEVRPELKKLMEHFKKTAEAYDEIAKDLVKFGEQVREYDSKKMEKPWKKNRFWQY